MMKILLPPVDAGTDRQTAQLYRQPCERQRTVPHF